LSKKETGTYAMPSGDTIQAAQIAFALFLFYDTYSVLLLIPLVAYGRVYFRCHWIGDTIVATILGVLYALIGFAYFSKFASLFLFYFPYGDS